MDFKKRLIEIRDFLKPYQNIWQNEIMLMYPNPFLGYEEAWIDELLKVQGQEDAIRIERKEVYDFITNPEMITYYRRIEELTRLPYKDEVLPMPEEAWTWLYMTPKKSYEIRRLAPYVAKVCESQGLDSVVDIGGGIGLLAQTLANQMNLKVSSIDMDPILQETGKKRNKNNFKDPKNLVTYFNYKVEEGGEFEKILSTDSLSVGLHTCGGLAVDILRSTSKKKLQAIVNFGCCYNKLEGKENVQNISAFAKEHGETEFSKFALTLSSRAHKKMNEKDYILKQKVKFYRYAFHILLHDKYQIEEEVFLGNSSKHLYEESFSTYALEQFKRTNIAVKHSAEELDDFFNSPALALLIRKMIAAGIIRNALGRVLELYLILDRCIYLEEQGYEVQVATFFDESISPRNIGITATL